jgi:hypothetical protein
MLKKLTRRDRIALGVLAAAAVLFILMDFAVLPLLDQVSTKPDTVAQKEAELRRERRLLAEKEFEKAHRAAAQDRVKVLEAGLLGSNSPSLANAEWQRLVGQMADSKGLELGSREFLRVQDLGAGYSLVLGRVQLRCRLDQLVDFLAALAASPKLLSVTGLTVLSNPSDAQGRLSVQLTIGAATRSLKTSPDDSAAPR